MVQRISGYTCGPGRIVTAPGRVRVPGRSPTSQPSEQRRKEGQHRRHREAQAMAIIDNRACAIQRRAQPPEVERHVTMRDHGAVKGVMTGGIGVTSRAVDAGAGKAVENAGAGASKVGGAPAAAEQRRTLPLGTYASGVFLRRVSCVAPAQRFFHAPLLAVVAYKCTIFSIQ